MLKLVFNLTVNSTEKWRKNSKTAIWPESNQNNRFSFAIYHRTRMLFKFFYTYTDFLTYHPQQRPDYCAKCVRLFFKYSFIREKTYNLLIWTAQNEFKENIWFQNTTGFFFEENRHLRQMFLLRKIAGIKKKLKITNVSIFVEMFSLKTTSRLSLMVTIISRGETFLKSRRKIRNERKKIHTHAKRHKYYRAWLRSFASYLWKLNVV